MLPDMRSTVLPDMDPGGEAAAWGCRRLVHGRHTGGCSAGMMSWSRLPTHPGCCARSVTHSGALTQLPQEGACKPLLFM